MTFRRGCELSGLTNIDESHHTACILCPLTCGIEIGIHGREIVRVRGDKAHPVSKGYICQKAHSLDLYQNASDRLSSPMRRRDDGSYEPVSWDVAIAEVAARLVAVKDEFGGESILYYGGGGQGNHLVGAYSEATRSALGSTFRANAFSQEKLGEAFVDQGLFGNGVTQTVPDVANAEVVVFLGKNPWQSHGFARSRVVLEEIVRDPNRTLLVIDPRTSETAAMADYHLGIRPGGDAFLLTAMLAILFEEGLTADELIKPYVSGLDAIKEVVASVDIASCCAKADVDEDLVREITRRMASASSMTIVEDLGIQQARHSALNSWLEKLVVITTGNFGRKGGVVLNVRLGDNGIEDSSKELRSPVIGHRTMNGLLPGALVAEEILSDHPARFRAMMVESANPVHSLPDSPAMRSAFDALDFSVVLDVAMTETARCADYVLPTSSQFEKPEAVFLLGGTPESAFHLRKPVFEPYEESLCEAEIHSRVLQAMGVLDLDSIAPLRAAAFKSRKVFTAAFIYEMAQRPDLIPLASVVLYETLGKALGKGMAGGAIVWGLAHRSAASIPDALRSAGFEGDGLALGDDLFSKILDSDTAVVFARQDHSASFDRLCHDDGRIHLLNEDLLSEFQALGDEDPGYVDPLYPFVLAAGERRGYTANTIIRDQSWRGATISTGLRIHPDDANRLGLLDGDFAILTTKTGKAEVMIEVTSNMRVGSLSLPNGFGLRLDAEAQQQSVGVSLNELTDAAHRDPYAGTPLHKHVLARLEPTQLGS